MKVVVGLGNPGAKYADTRHNVGFWLIDRLAKQLAVSLKRAGEEGLVGRGASSGHDVLLVKPQTFMNQSGRAVRAVSDKHAIPPTDIMIVYDDLALQPGALRIRGKGSAGGHNGIKSIIDYLGTECFPRLRLGIGQVPAGVRGVDYVLSAPEFEEQQLLEAALEAAVSAVLSWMDEGVERAMSRYNGLWGNPQGRT